MNVKKFRFPLGPILRVEQHELADALANHRELESLAQQTAAAKQLFLESVERQEKELRAEFARSPYSRVLFEGRRQMLEHRDALLASINLRLTELASLLEESTERVALHKREVARLEKVREKSLAQHHDLVKKSEQEALDELSLSRFSRQQAANW